MSDSGRTGGGTGEAVVVAVDATAEQPKPIETEATLVIAADAPEAVADAVAELNELEGFALLHAPDLSIRDRYLDTPDGAVGASGLAVRLRELGTTRLVTIKGPRRPGALIGVTREEQEQPWPDRAWALVRAELGATLRIPASPPASDPIRALEALGLIVVQARTTERRVRAVLPRTGGRARVAELAIDAVVYDLGGRSVRHHELELEVKGENGDAAVATLADGLVARFGPSLRLWHLGKLATGGALARLIEERGPDAVLTPGGGVRPAAYALIEAGW